MPSLPVPKGSLEAYLVEINSFPLLNPEEEFRLAVRFRKYNDLEAAHSLVTANLRFVVKVAFEYRSYGIGVGDLIQEGNIGLTVALKKFDPHRGYRLISYAIWWIRASIQNFIMKNWSLVKIGTTQAEKRLFYKIGKVRKALEAQSGNPKRYERLAKDLKVNEKDIIEMEQRMSSRDVSLNLPFDQDHEHTALDLIPEHSPDQEEIVAQREEKKLRERAILDAMDHLNEKERYIISNRILSESPKTLQEVGGYLKISRERVRQIEARALQKLRKDLDGAKDGHAPASDSKIFDELKKESFLPSSET